MRCLKLTQISVLIFLTFFLISMIGMTGSAKEDINYVSDDDTDGDGLNNTEERAAGTNETSPDTDGDGLTDKYELDNYLDPNDPKEPYRTGIYEQKEDWDRKETRDSLLNTALFTFLMGFAIFALLAGAFTAYFGAGKSRAIGGALMLIGLVVILVWIYFGVMQTYPDDTLLGIVHWEAAKTLEAFVTVLAALIGAVAAIGLFLVAIMKS